MNHQATASDSTIVPHTTSIAAEAAAAKAAAVADEKARIKYRSIAFRFMYGGEVTPNEASIYLRIDAETIKRTAIAGHIPFRRSGKNQTMYIDALAAKAALGTGHNSAFTPKRNYPN